jgi:hypothetical protein
MRDVAFTVIEIKLINKLKLNGLLSLLLIELYDRKTLVSISLWIAFVL